MEVICRSRNTDPLNKIKKLLKKRRAELKPPKVKSLQNSSLAAVDKSLPPKTEHKKRKIEVSSECSLKKKPKLDHCQGILTKLMKQKWSVPFLHPVDPYAAGDYFQVVKHPMDFATIKRKLQQNKYLDDDEFAADVRLIFSNATLNHPSDNWVHLYATKLSRVFDILWLPVKPTLVKEPDYSLLRAARIAKLKREQDRKAARVALEQMERSITLDDNLGAMRELEALMRSNHDNEVYDGFWIQSKSGRRRSPLERLGLFIKPEYRLGYEDDDDLFIQSADLEEGEILV